MTDVTCNCAYEKAKNIIMDKTSHNPVMIKNTPENTKTILDDITEHLPDFIVKNAEKVASKIEHAGHQILDYAQKNPKTYFAGVAGAGVAALVTGIAVGRISKQTPQEEEKNNIEITLLEEKIIKAFPNSN